MKRKIYLLIIVIALLVPVFFALRSQAITYWLTGPDYRIKDNTPLPTQVAVANSANLISLDYIQPDLSRLPFLLNLEGHHVYGGSPFTVDFYPNGAIIRNKDDKVGVVDDSGQVIVPFWYDRIRYSDSTFMAVATDNPTVYYAENGQPLFQTSQPVQTMFSDGLVYLSNGVHDKAGNMIFEPEVPLLDGWKDGVAAGSNGNHVTIYQKDGQVVTKLAYPEVFDWIDGYVLVGDGPKRELVTYQGEVVLRLNLDGDGQFSLETPEGNNFAGLKYDLIELLGEDRLLLRHKLTYRYYDFKGNALIDPELALLEPFQEGFSLSQSGGYVHLYNQEGKLVKSIEGSYVPNTLSENTLVIVRQSLNGQDSHYLYSTSGKQLTYRPLGRIMPRRQGISLVFEAAKGVGYLREEVVTEWVFVPSKLLQAGRFSLPIGLGVLLLLFLFIRRYKL